MTQHKKYIVILILLMLIVLCAVGASTWVITNPVPFRPALADGKTPIYVRRIVEFDYNDGGVNWYVTNGINSKIEFVDSSLKDISTTIRAGVTIGYPSGATVTNGDITHTSSENLTIGSTYLTQGGDGLTLTLSEELGKKYYIAGIYDYIENNSLTNLQDVNVSNSNVNQYYCGQLLLKYKTVEVGNTLYTIEDALNIASSGTVRLKGNATKTIETSFTALKDSKTGYSDAHRTIKAGVTLLLPYEDSDTKGYFPGQEWEYGTAVTGLPHDFKDTNCYVAATIPQGITVTNKGVLTVGALTGAQGDYNANGNYSTSGHIGRISGGYSVITLNGTLNSTGKLNIYGNIKGIGAINVNAGTVLERFEIPNWKGGSDAAGKFMGNKSIGLSDVFKITGGGTITENDPNEFPFEEYLMQAVVGPTLNISYSASYQGDVRIYTQAQEQAGVKLPAKLSVAPLTIVSTANGSSANGIYGLKNGSKFVKTVVDGKENITIIGGMVGGKASLNLSVVKATIQMDTGNLKFPISKQIVLTFSGGDSLSNYGYEIMPGAIVKLTDGASLTFNDTDDGVIVYDKAVFTVGGKSSLVVNGKFGGTVRGESNASLTFSSGANLVNSGYIGGSGGLSVSSFKFTFSGDEVSRISQGNLFYSDGVREGNFVAGTTYTHNGEYWGTSSSYSIVYHDNFSSNYDVLYTYVNNTDIWHGMSYSPTLTEVQAPTTTRNYYMFTGWYYDKDCTRPVENDIIAVKGGETVDLYAGWQKVKYTLNYVVYGDDHQPINSGYEFVFPDSKTLANYTTWTIEDTLDFEGFELSSDTLTFFGWYNNGQFDTQATVLNTDTIGYFTINADNSITIYGWLGMSHVYEVQYSYEKPTGDGDFYAVGRSDYTESVDTSDRPIVNSDHINDELIGEESVNDLNNKRKYYFLGWFDESDNPVSPGATIQSTMDANGDGTIVLTAKWAKKASITITGAYTDSSLDGYYKPGATLAINFNVTQDDYDVNFKTYFAGWNTSGHGEVVATGTGYGYTVPINALGATITIEAKQADKAILTIEHTGNATISFTFYRNDGEKSEEYETNKKYYLTPGTTVDYTIKMSYTISDRGSSKSATWSWSINGPNGWEYNDGKSGTSDNAGSQSKIGSFVMPDANVTIKADSQDGACIAEGTLIMLADGTQKPIEDIKPGDKVLVFNHESGRYEEGTMWFIDDIDSPANMYRIINLVFSNNTNLRISYQHAAFDLDENKYVFINESNMNDYIGHRFVTTEYINGEFVSGETVLVNAYVTEEYVRVFGPISEYHFNLVTDGLLTMPSFNFNVTGMINIFEYGEGLKYDEAKMQADIEKYGLFTYEEFADLLPYEVWLQAPTAYFKVAIGKGILTWEEIEMTIEYLYGSGYVG